MKRYNPGISLGLTSKQVNERIKENLVNYDVTVPTKSIPRIIRDNVITLFVFLHLILGGLVISVGSYKNLLFLGVVVCNITISILQSIRAKITTDKLALLSLGKVKVIRNGKHIDINHDELVLDDLMVLKPGNQVVADAIIIDGSCDVNESFISGEADNIHKEKGDMLLSGSFIVSDRVIAKVEHIAELNYSSIISKDAKYIKNINSKLKKYLNYIIKAISIIIIPIGIFLFINQLSLENNTVNQAVINTVAALIGMIPDGLILLTSTVLAISTIKLSKKNVLVQELFCIETIAHIDTICFDKTGTLTEGYMEVSDVVSINKSNKTDINNIMTFFVNNMDNDNATMDAIKRKYGGTTKLEVLKRLPFSSSYGYSAITNTEGQTYILGAPDKIAKNYDISKYLADHRVVMLAVTDSEIEGRIIPKDIKPLALILLQDKIRSSAKDTLDYFKNRDVDVKIISGDNVITVENIASRIGMSDIKAINVGELNDKDLSMVVNDYNIFGRVRPEQKKKIIQLLKENGKMVAMVGDGVNDVLALKESDSSITIASGTEAARNISGLVLLDNNFDSIPKIVDEGRQTFNNIQRSGTLYLTKTIYSTLLAIIFIFINKSYPFMPIQYTLINIFTIGIPSLLLALEPNKERIKGNFIKNIIRGSFPTAVTSVGNILLILLISNTLSLPYIDTSTISVIMIAFVGFMLLYKICTPFNKLRYVLFILMIALFGIMASSFNNVFSLSHMSITIAVICLCLMIYSIIIFDYLTKLVDYIFKRYPNIINIK